jgi:hypothetical protein
MVQREPHDASEVVHGSSLITGHGKSAAAIALAALAAGTRLVAKTLAATKTAQQLAESGELRAEG